MNHRNALKVLLSCGVVGGALMAQPGYSATSSPRNCMPRGVDAKCDIIVAGHTGVTIKNRNVTGAFTCGVDVESSSDVTVQDTSVTLGEFGFNFSYDVGVAVDNILASDMTSAAVHVYYDQFGYYSRVSAVSVGSIFTTRTGRL